jgi:hypothetical protein
MGKLNDVRRWRKKSARRARAHFFLQYKFLSAAGG